MNKDNNNNTPYGNDMVDYEIEDMDSQHGYTAQGIKDLALKQFQRCQELGSKDMHPGGSRKVLINGRVEEIIVPDTMDAFCNAVKMLHITLYPKKIEKKNDMKNHWKEHEKELEAFNGFCRNIKDSNLNGNVIGDYTSEIYTRKVELNMLLLEKLSILMSLCNYFNEGVGTA